MPPAPKQPAVPDQDQRDAAIFERTRNVLVDAGAGTGKTTLLVERLVNMIAPAGGGQPLHISRIAAITFTRRAAGELRLRIRERLLGGLAEPRVTKERRKALRDALAGLDTAYVGTIHSFADRLLRLRPMEADIGPAYEVVEDAGELIAETADLLIDAAQTETLTEALSGTPAAERAEEAVETVLSVLHAGVRADSLEREHVTRHGLGGLVGEFVKHRDNPPAEPPPVSADLEAFRCYADEFIGLVAPVGGSSPGVRWLKRAARLVQMVRDETDPALIFRSLARPLKDGPHLAQKGAGFDNDDHAYGVWRALDGDDRKKALRPGCLRDELMGPLRRWLATRLVRLFPVVIALYERVKERHRALDQVDVLLKLRDLLKHDKGARGYYQSLFDHILVDEFQDTDPLQAEVICYLSESAPRARGWKDVKLTAGKLTIVGDPKQSIYRFRRADIGMYHEVRKLVRSQGCTSARLSVNFRSTAPVIEWLNDRFEHILGVPPATGDLFNPDTGEVFHQPLQAHWPADPPRVHVLPFDGDGFRDDDYRALEAKVLARYLRWLVEVKRLQIRDPLADSERTVNYGDIAILAVSTPSLRFLFPALDEMGVPHSARGGRLFLQDRLHRQFLLGLRALADKDDGVANAALLRPPFFAVDLIDLVHHRGAGETERSERVRRAEAVLELVRDLRRRRFERPPGATARDLLERTAIGRTVALGPNGAQRLERLREICLILEQKAALECLDYDRVTASLREWVLDPVELDPPHPVGTPAVRVMTVHQAKGLEFPVVVLWDGRAKTRATGHTACWRVSRDGQSWMLELDGLPWEEPAGAGLKQRESQYAAAERKRLIYVAVTRARDLVVVPKAGSPAGQHICGALLADCDAKLVSELDLYRADGPAKWADGVRPVTGPAATAASDLEVKSAKRWHAAATASARPRFQPVAVSGESALAADEVAAASRKRGGRYGAVFGETVHQAIGFVLRDPSVSPQQTVSRVAKATGLTVHLEEAAADVARAVDALKKQALFRHPGPDLRLEYPVAGPAEGGKLLVGYVDLVATAEDGLEDGLVVLDFKTDRPPDGPVELACAQYVAQVRTYGDLLRAGGSGGGANIRCGLLFTANGQIQWAS